MVRLKVAKVETKKAIFVIFQFLMVRLKVAKVETKKAIFVIFQFLMVRLKAKSVMSNNVLEFNISIPYGAIKRKIS